MEEIFPGVAVDELLTGIQFFFGHSGSLRTHLVCSFLRYQSFLAVLAQGYAATFAVVDCVQGFFLADAAVFQFVCYVRPPLMMYFSLKRSSSSVSSRFWKASSIAQSAQTRIIRTPFWQRLCNTTAWQWMHFFIVKESSNSTVNYSSFTNSEDLRPGNPLTVND